MPRHRERRWPWLAAGYAVLFAVIAAATGFIYDAAAPANRPMTIRLAVAFVVGVLLIHLRNYFRGDPRWERPSAFEDALIRQPNIPKLDAGFVKLREEVANSTASRSYFKKVLRPRLCALSSARARPDALPMPAERGWFGRGPSRRTIAALVDRIETR
jgi:hypothetical protein